MFESRLRVVFGLGVLYFVVLLGRLFTMQVLDAEDWREKGRRLSQGRVHLAARRGDLLDRRGEVLAADRHEWDLMIRLDHYEGSSWRCRECGRPAVSTDADSPTRCRECRSRGFEPGPERDNAGVASLLGLTNDEFYARLSAVRADLDRHVDREIKRIEEAKRTPRIARIRAGFAGWIWPLVTAVSPEVVKEISLDPERYRGLVIRSAFRRSRPAGGAIENLIGRVGEVTREDARVLNEQGVSYSDIYRMRVGVSGMEKVLEDRLAARTGFRNVDRDARGRVRKVLKEVPAKDGETVRISLDLSLQNHMAEELERAARRHGARGAFFTALDPKTGEVLVFAGWAKKKDGIHLGTSPTVPGSVFKVVTAIAGIESNELSPTELFDCLGQWHGIGCHEKVHDHIDMVDALAVSCNGYFGHAADLMGIEILSWWAKRLGFGKQTGLEVDREPTGLVPDAEWKLRRYETSENFRKAFKSGDWQRGETWQVGFGQGALLVTPIQVARLMAIVANGGYEVRPTLLAGQGRLGERLLEPRTVNLVRDGLEDVIRRGTASKVNLGEYRVAGKTGTGDLPRGKLGLKNVAWFAGYAPAEAPTIAFACCFVDVKGYGGGVAGPACAAFLKRFTKR